MNPVLALSRVDHMLVIGVYINELQVFTCFGYEVSLDYKRLEQDLNKMLILT